MLTVIHSHEPRAVVLVEVPPVVDVLRPARIVVVLCPGTRVVVIDLVAGNGRVISMVTVVRVSWVGHHSVLRIRSCVTRYSGFECGGCSECGGKEREGQFISVSLRYSFYAHDMIGWSIFGRCSVRQGRSISTNSIQKPLGYTALAAFLH